MWCVVRVSVERTEHPNVAGLDERTSPPLDVVGEPVEGTSHFHRLMRDGDNSEDCMPMVV